MTVRKSAFAFAFAFAFLVPGFICACSGTVRGINDAYRGPRKLELGEVTFAPYQLPATPDPNKMTLIIGTGASTSTWLPISGLPTPDLRPMDDLAVLALENYLFLPPQAFVKVSGIPDDDSAAQVVANLATLTDIGLMRPPRSGLVLPDGTLLRDNDVVSLADAYLEATGQPLPYTIPAEATELALSNEEMSLLAQEYAALKKSLAPIWPKLLAAHNDIGAPQALARLTNRSLLRARAAEARQHANQPVMALERLGESMSAAMTAAWLMGWPEIADTSTLGERPPLAPSRCLVLAQTERILPLPARLALSERPPSIRRQFAEADGVVPTVSARSRAAAWVKIALAVMNLPEADAVGRWDLTGPARAELKAHVKAMLALEGRLQLRRDPLSGAGVAVKRPELLSGLVEVTDDSARRWAHRAKLATGQIPLLARYHYQAARERLQGRDNVETQIDTIEGFLYSSMLSRLAEANARASSP
jgi:hypothetical protein